LTSPAASACGGVLAPATAFAALVTAFFAYGVAQADASFTAAALLVAGGGVFAAFLGGGRVGGRGRVRGRAGAVGG